MTFLVGWLIIGLVGSLAAIYTFRRNGTTRKTGELYMAAIGPFFGPVIIILLILDLSKKTR